ncbi:MAG: hypothetical protein GH150_02080 [Hadesarchaea archaeon]|nr:hypothetical protein [Hadesarchaea archaeon]TES83471.1 MAG: hypothetical protein E3J91_02075 [Hadesarchaea archaeon]
MRVRMRGFASYTRLKDVLKLVLSRVKPLDSEMVSFEQALGRVDVVRVRVWSEADELLAEPIRVTGSSILSSMTHADGFFLIPEDVEGFEKGQTVELELYS